MNRTRTIALLATLLLIEGCSLRSMSVRATSTLLQPGMAALEGESDVILARESAATQLKLGETLNNAEPGRTDVLQTLTQGFGGYAFAFLDFEAEKNVEQRERAKALYARGLAYGLELLDQRVGKGTSATLLGGTLEEGTERLRRANKADVPALFWTAYNWAGKIRKDLHSPESMSELPRAVLLAERVLELDPTYHFGAPHLFFGVYYAERPPLVGGNPKKADFHFSEAKRIGEGKYVMTDYLRARFLATRLQDRKSFTALLRGVVTSPVDVLPEQRLAQEVARSWAKQLLDNPGDYFEDE